MPEPACADAVDLESYSETAATTAVGKRSHASQSSVMSLVSEAEAVQATKTIRTLRRRELLWIVFSAFLLCGLFCTSIVAIQVTKELHVKDAQLLDSQGQEVFTRNQVDTIEGVQDDPNPERRRLAENSTEGAEQTAPLMIVGKWLRKVKKAYRKGQSEWVVKLPDDSTRTVRIMGMSRKKAWGFCGDCLGNIGWLAECEDWASRCPITWIRSSEDRRLSVATAAALASRAAAGAGPEQALPMPMERALSGKQCA